MQKFNTLKSIPAYLPIVNIDTDMIIPKQFLKTIKRTGLGKNLFFEMRYDDQGKEISDFVLNQNPYNGSKILIAGKNFGCGSSREHAVWALKDYGIEAIISTSFADIFYRNSFKNGLLLISVNKDELENIFSEISESPKYNLTINIQNQTITTPSGQAYSFTISDSDKERIILEYDDIELSLRHKDKVKNYEDNMKLLKPWIFEKNND